MATTLGLVVIAKDVAGTLAAFLEHHRPLVDAVTVVDTGSRDTTAAIAAQAGADVVAFPWCDDFAAARNAGLAAARTDWIVILDTDEVVAPRDFPRVRAALTDPSRVRVQPTVNYCADMRHPQWRPVSGRYPREEAGQTGYFLANRAGLFPRRDDLRFTGRVHESILPSATRAGVPYDVLDVPVHHYGFVKGSARNHERRRVYRALVERKVADTPDDPGALLELAVVRIEDGSTRAAVPLLERVAASRDTDSSVTQARFLLGRLLRESGEPARAADLLAGAVVADARLIFCWVEWLRALADLERWDAMEHVLARARARFGDDPLLAKEELRCLARTGRLDAAAEIVRRLARLYPHWEDMGALARRLDRHARTAAAGRAG